MSGFETVAWHQGRVRLIDQRVLPGRELYLECDGAEATARAIRDMVVRGAPAIGCTAAFGLASEAFRLAREGGVRDWPRALSLAMETLRQARPTAVNLAWAIDRLAALVTRDAGEELPETLLREAQAIHAEDLASCRAMGRLGAEVLPETPGRAIHILTHCNAGGLATAGYGTALGVIRAAREAGREVMVLADETRPFLQGARLTAWELLQDGIETTLICDNMAGYLMSLGEVDAIVVGADRVAANGDVANKIGTYSLAVLAGRHGIPFFVACPLSTIDLATPRGHNIPIEERPVTEVTHLGEKRVAVEGVRVRNPAFDITPAELVTALVTEKEVVWSPDEERIRRLFEDS